MAEPEYPVLRELETKLKLQWVDTDDYLATQRAIIEVTPDHAYLELPRGRKGDKGDPGNAISFQGIVARTSDLPTGLTAADAAKAWVNTATKALHVWNGDQWFTVNNFAGVDADVQRFSQWFAHAADAARTAREEADRAEYWANETIQQVTGDFATQNYVDDARYLRPALTSSSNVDALTPGLYPVSSGARAAQLGLPEATIGWIHHVDLDPARTYRRQYYRADSTYIPAVNYRRTYSSGTWNAWRLADPIPHRRGKIPTGVTPDTMIGSDFEGLWDFDSKQAAEWESPSPAAGFVEVFSSGNSTFQRMTSLTTPIREFQRRWYNGAWSTGWREIGGGALSGAGEYESATNRATTNLLIPSVVDPTLSYEDDHAALVADLKSRLGAVTTGGKAAVALVADHGTTAFKEWLWAEAKARNIPFTMALAPEVHIDDRGDSRHAASNEDIKQWISEGLAIASHSSDHGGAVGYFDIHRQIVTSKQKLEEKLDTRVDAWVQPGYSTALGNYDGFGTGQNATVYSGTVAGRLLQQTYPVITGYAGSSYVYPSDQDLPVGVRRSLTERKDNQASVIANIEQAITTGGKHINFCHPYALPDSSSTYVTKSEYIAYLDWLVQKRDAGDLVLLTLPQLAISR